MKAAQSGADTEAGGEGEERAQEAERGGAVAARGLRDVLAPGTCPRRLAHTIAPSEVACTVLTATALAPVGGGGGHAAAELQAPRVHRWRRLGGGRTTCAVRLRQAAE